MPNMFQANNQPQRFSYQSEAMSAFLFATGMTTGVFSMAIFGSCWIFNISTPKEFSSSLRSWMGLSDLSQDSGNDILDEESSNLIEQLTNSYNKD
ncbi:hypothetical protein Kpol_1018p87 [Vanderwaltozyma polyspora DSM 70294]|uniref:Altered inheritance of mitochondria protein 11 n=1 Tax=Vanderwaltozyma polyspora (strain ATCC 22028 / DSM 70294 / BCRC 21397 / CBS 2163 / NBRC 10782 / NRRL Y-8283 / UCD 57-17) TaxID=436907 RepID=A7TDT4_VANPO|nr:uncharacterized protein Kpol_1018p87 [Vanderwaltozyma polyspora DSM 70294]EDO19554.1 hypothetical protein Kpol_1018p87 [Vanderwaltozyma polyspora DSM 70294]